MNQANQTTENIEVTEQEQRAAARRFAMIVEELSKASFGPKNSDEE